MATNDYKPRFSVLALISQQYVDLSNILQKVKEQFEALKLLRVRSMQRRSRPQTAENRSINDAKAEHKGDSTPFKDPTNKKPTNTSVISDEQKVHNSVRQRARRVSGRTGSGLRNETTKKTPSRAKKKGNVSLWTALAMLILIPGVACGHDEQTMYAGINEESLILIDGAKYGNLDELILTPESDPYGIVTLKSSDGPPKYYSCGGFRFGEDGSFIIDVVKRCHAGKYTAEYRNGESFITVERVLTVNDTAEGTASMETTNAYDAAEVKTPNKTCNTSDTMIKSSSPAMGALISCICVSIVVTAIVVSMILYLKGKCTCLRKSASASGTKDSVQYVAVVRTEEV